MIYVVTHRQLARAHLVSYVWRRRNISIDLGVTGNFVVTFPFLIDTIADKEC